MRAVGPDFELMVDAHTWWRMGDRSWRGNSGADGQRNILRAARQSRFHLTITKRVEAERGDYFPWPAASMSQTKIAIRFDPSQRDYADRRLPPAWAYVMGGVFLEISLGDETLRWGPIWR
jgi:hypothetical protein